MLHFWTNLQTSYTFFNWFTLHYTPCVSIPSTQYITNIANIFPLHQPTQKTTPKRILPILKYAQDIPYYPLSHCYWPQSLANARTGRSIAPCNSNVILILSHACHVFEAGAGRGVGGMTFFCLTFLLTRCESIRLRAANRGKARCSGEDVPAATAPWLPPEKPPLPLPPLGGGVAATVPQVKP